MEDDRQNTPNSGELSSSDFEFGSLTPSSPSQDPFSDHSPADHLFLNCRLLPHTFPTARSVSRTTSENTFRSNSTSSRSSDSSSPTSTCNVFKITSSNTNITCFGPRSEKIMSQRSETKQLKTSLILDSKKKPPMNNGKISYLPTHCKRKNKATEIVTAQLYGSYSRRWQHITPVFQREGSVKSSSGGGLKVGGRKKKTKTVKKKKTEERRGSKLMKWWKKILKAVVLACRECHAMEPQRLVNE